MIYRHPVIAATRALRFADHVIKRSGGSGDENGKIAAWRGTYACGDVDVNVDESLDSEHKD